jgi:hypothetical protein
MAWLLAVGCGAAVDIATLDNMTTNRRIHMGVSQRYWFLLRTRTFPPLPLPFLLPACLRDCTLGITGVRAALLPDTFLLVMYGDRIITASGGCGRASEHGMAWKNAAFAPRDVSSLFSVDRLRMGTSGVEKRTSRLMPVFARDWQTAGAAAWRGAAWRGVITNFWCACMTFWRGVYRAGGLRCFLAGRYLRLLNIVSAVPMNYGMWFGSQVDASIFSSKTLRERVVLLSF